MIRKYKDGLEVIAGQWGNFESMFRDGLAGRPAQITKVAGKRVYYITPRKVKADEYEEFKALKSLAYVSDTEDEAKFVSEASMHQMDAIRKMTGHVEEAIKERIEAHNAK